jgi:uncharacterized protein YaiE (UPF0345 family)
MKFENVTVVKAANIYFDGRFTSRTVEFADGTEKTLGIMLPGEYEFGTVKKEIMEILSGDLEDGCPVPLSGKRSALAKSSKCPPRLSLSSKFLALRTIAVPIWRSISGELAGVLLLSLVYRMG